MRRSNPTDVQLPGPLQGWHVMVIFLGFFGSIFAVNGYFIFRSLATHSGVVSEEPYRKGLGYNQRIAANDRQTALHWRADLDVNTTGAVTFALHDAAGQPVGNQRVTLSVGRPSTRSFDRTLALAEIATGVYAGTIAGLGAGTWIADADVQDPQTRETNYRLRRRLWLTP